MELKSVEEFLRNKTYPKGNLKDKGKKANFRKECENFRIVNGDLMYKEKRRVVFEAYRGRESTYQKISKRFFWHGIIEVCTLSEVDRFKHLIVCIDYFSKWSEAKAVNDKSAPTVASFLYEIICQHGCMRIQINDQ